MEGCVYEQTIQRSLLEDLQCIPSKTGNRGDAEPTKDKINSFAFTWYIFRLEMQDDALITDTHPQPSGGNQARTSHNLPA